MNGSISLFDILWDALSPYAFDILKLSLAITLLKQAISIIRAKGGHMSAGGNNPYSGVFMAFIGYLLGKGIPISIKIIDQICDQIIANIR